MKTIYEMSAKELKEIARAKYMHGAWKATKAQMIAFLEEIGYKPEEIVEETIEAVEGEDLDTDEEETIEEVETEETGDDEEEETTKVVKKPSLGINSIEFNGKMQSLKAWADSLRSNQS